MKKNKVVSILLSLMTNIKIKDKRIRYAVLAVLGVALAASTQLTNLDGTVESIEPSKSVIEEVLEEGVDSAAEEVIGSILENLF